MSEMENLGLLRNIHPPRLEDAGLEDCALPPASIHEAFLKAAAAVGSRLIASDDRDCVGDPWTEVLSPPSVALVGIESEPTVPGDTEKKDCVDGMRGLKIKEREDDDDQGDDDEKPTLVEGYF